MSELISVIVPVYKVEQYLRACVDSIINQTYENLEIILVDDGSPDNCGRICDEYKKKDSRIKVIHKKNGGLSDARNAGIEAAEGQFLGFVDGDDLIEENMFEKLYNGAKKHSAKICCGGRYDLVGDRKVRGLCFRKEGLISAEEMLRKIFRQRECDVSVCDKLFHKSLAEKLQFPFGEIHEDGAIILEVILAAEKVAVIDEPVYTYRHRENSITTQKLSKKNLVILKNTGKMVDYCEKNRPSLARYAKGYDGKKTLELCIRAKGRKAVTEDDEKLKKELLKELKSKKRLLFPVDRLRYIILSCGVYGAVKRFLKGM